MIEALKDYNEMVLKPSMKWCKKHWKGYIALCAASYVVGYGIGYVVFYKDDIKERIESKFHKEES